MRVLIRVDIGAEHGMGHAVRCKALAQVLTAQGVGSTFVTTTPALGAFVAPHEVWNFRPEPESAILRTLLDRHERQSHEHWVVVLDHKGFFDEAFLLQMRLCGRGNLSVVRIDHPQAEPGTADLLIAPVAHWTHQIVCRLRADFGARFLYGWDYVMLDDAVRQQVPVPYAMRQEGPTVFCAGGSDPMGVLQTMYDWTAEMPAEFPLIFLLGSQASYAWRGLEMKTLDRQNRPHMATFTHAYLSTAALVIGLCGVIPYECLFFRTPMLSFGHTDETRKDSLLLEIVSKHAVRAMGDAGTLPQAFCDMVRFYRTSLATRTAMHDASAALLDGRGVERVASAILALADAA